MEFLTGGAGPLYDISAYMNGSGDEDLETVVADLFADFAPEDTVLIMTDLMSGSVNQKFFPYINDHVFLLTGVNVPLALQLMLADEEQLTADFVQECVKEAQKQIVFVNEWQKQNCAGEEDE